MSPTACLTVMLTPWIWKRALRRPVAPPAPLRAAAAPRAPGGGGRVAPGRGVLRALRSQVGGKDPPAASPRPLGGGGGRRRCGAPLRAGRPPPPAPPPHPPPRGGRPRRQHPDERRSG